MKIYAFIDEHETIVSFTEKSLAPKKSKEYEVSHIDELKIVDGEIVIDSSIKNSIDKFKEEKEKNNTINDLKNKILELLIEKEMRQVGIILENEEQDLNFTEILKLYYNLKKTNS
jgi:hypothetical protein